MSISPEMVVPPKGVPTSRPTLLSTKSGRKLTGGALSSFATSPYGAASQLASVGESQLPGVSKSRRILSENLLKVNHSTKNSAEFKNNPSTGQLEMVTAKRVFRNGKIQFASIKQIEPIGEELCSHLKNVELIKNGKKLLQAPVAILPDLVNNKHLILSKTIVDKVTKDHGNFPSENFILTANKPNKLVIIDNGNKINLIKQFGRDNFFLIGANKTNGYYTVTFFEPENADYISKRVLSRGKVVDVSGGAFSSFATSPFGAASQLASPQKRFPGVRKSKDNIAQKPRIVKLTKNYSKKGGKTLNPQKISEFLNRFGRAPSSYIATSLPTARQLGETSVVETKNNVTQKSSKIKQKAKCRKINN